MSLTPRASVTYSKPQYAAERQETMTTRMILTMMRGAEAITSACACGCDVVALEYPPENLGMVLAEWRCRHCGAVRLRGACMLSFLGDPADWVAPLGRPRAPVDSDAPAAPPVVSPRPRRRKSSSTT